MVPNDTLNDIESQSGSFANRLGGEERIEYAVFDVRGNSCSVINKLDENSVRLNASSDVEQFRLARWKVFHRMDRIVDEIGPNLVQCAAIRSDAWQVLSKLTRYLNAMLELVLKHAQRHIDTLFDIHFGDWALVHIGVRFNGLHKIGHTARGLFQLSREAEDLVVGNKDAESKREDFSGDE